MTGTDSRRSVLLLINPHAGQCRGRTQLATVIDVFNRAGWRVSTFLTEKGGDAEQEILTCPDDVDLVVCCGGDGTFNEAVSGVIKSGRPLPIGYLPAGSTNDFAATLSLSSDLKKAARDVVNGEPMELDIGRFGDRFFSYVASFGAFTRTSYTTPQAAKNLLGHAAYVLGGIQELTQLHPYPMRIELPDGEVLEDSFLFGAVANTTSIGGILKFPDSAVTLNDGLFEMVLVREPKGLAELSECIQALQHQTYDCDMLTFRRADRFRVTAPSDMLWTLDGEREEGHETVTVDCLPRAVTFIRPPHEAEKQKK